MVIDMPLTGWTPDIPDMNNPGLITAFNVVPAIGIDQNSVTYNPTNQAEVYADAVLPQPPLGVAVGSDKAGTTHVYAGTQNNLYQFSASTRLWSSVTRLSGPYSTTESESWRFIQYTQSSFSGMIATNYSDFPQIIDMDLGLRFDDLTTLVRGRHINQHKGFVILADTYDGLDGPMPNRVRWSALDNPYDWNFSASTQADFQDIQNVGPINGMTVDDDVWLLCKDAIVRMHYVGTPWLYQFDIAVNGKGCAYPESVVQVDGVTYFLDDDGFYSFRKGNVVPIGLGKVNNYFYDRFNASQASRMTAVVDPKKTLIYWSYVSNDSTDNIPDAVLVYNYITGQWSEIASTVPYLYPSKTLSWTIEQLDVFLSMDKVPASWDSPIWAGGNSILWGLDTEGRIYTLTGPTLPAQLETKLMQLTQGSGTKNIDMAVVLGVRPIFESEGFAQIDLGHKRLPNGNMEWGTPKPTNTETGWSAHRCRDRYHTVRINLTDEWRKASALQIDFVPSGGR